MKIPCRPISVRQLQIRSPFGTIFLGFIFLLTDRPCSRGYIFVNMKCIVIRLDIEIGRESLWEHFRRVIEMKERAIPRGRLLWFRVVAFKIRYYSSPFVSYSHCTRTERCGGKRFLPCSSVCFLSWIHAVTLRGRALLSKAASPIAILYLWIVFRYKVVSERREGRKIGLFTLCRIYRNGESTALESRSVIRLS